MTLDIVTNMKEIFFESKCNYFKICKSEIDLGGAQQVSEDLGELNAEDEVEVKIVMHPKGPKGNPGPQVH